MTMGSDMSLSESLNQETRALDLFQEMRYRTKLSRTPLPGFFRLWRRPDRPGLAIRHGECPTSALEKRDNKPALDNAR